MARNFDSDAPGRGSRRRRSDFHNSKNAFQWDSVDDQAQEDLIEPVAVPKRKKSRARRSEHVANTLYVSNPYEDVYAPIKKKPIKTKQAEDYASFVAEVDDDEIDPYAIPSYGSTRLTQDDEEFVEELASQPERGRRNRRKPAAPEEAPVDELESRTSRRSRKPARPAEDVEDVEAPETKKAAPGKRSFLSKIQKAVGVASTAESAADVQLSQKRLNDLSRATQKILESLGSKSDSKFDRKEKSQIEVLASAVEALVNSHLALLDKVQNDASDKPEADAAPVAERQKPSRRRGARVEEEEEEQAPKKTRDNRSRRRASDVEDLESERDAYQDEAPRSKSPRNNRRSAPVEDFYDDDPDPIAFWERIGDEEDEEETVEPVSRPSRRGGSNARTSRRDSDVDFDDEVDSKKKSPKNARRDAKPSAEAVTDERDETTTPAADDASDKPAPRSRKRSKSSEENASEAETGKPLRKFGNLELKKQTLKALQAMGYSEPSPIQAGTIPTIQKGVDVMGQARTGTGKTAAFMIPIVEAVAECDPVGAPLAVAVLPTRELAVQVRDEAERIARYYNLSIAACYGGTPLASQVEKLRRGVDILVGTPGRIIDLANRGALSLGSARWVVLDEADRMLDIGFRPDVERILRQTPRTRQTLLFSATLPPPVVHLAKTYMHDPEQFDFSQNDVSAETIEQFYMTVDQDRKFEALTRLLEVQQPHQAIVFCRTKRHVDMVARRLTAKFPNVEAIHGDLPQSKRDRIMRDFRAEKTKVLVATDVVGRGIDVSTVSHIVNYDVPQYCDDYVHRVGRAGRMGREGVAFTLVTAEEGSELTRIEIRINRLLDRYEIPGFEAFSRPSETAEKEAPVRKPVFGHATRRVSHAL